MAEGKNTGLSRICQTCHVAVSPRPARPAPPRREGVPPPGPQRPPGGFRKLFPLLRGPYRPGGLKRWLVLGAGAFEAGPPRRAPQWPAEGANPNPPSLRTRGHSSGSGADARVQGSLSAPFPASSPPHVPERARASSPRKLFCDFSIHLQCVSTKLNNLRSSHDLVNSKKFQIHISY